MAVAHEDPEKVAYAMSLAERYPPNPDAPRGTPFVLRTGRPDMEYEVTDEMLDRRRATRNTRRSSERPGPSVLDVRAHPCR